MKSRGTMLVWHRRPGGVLTITIVQPDLMKSRKYSYRRDLPHIEKAERAHFITFDTYHRWILPPPARDLVLKHCLHDNGKKFQLLVAVVMPDHVHMIFAPLRDHNTEPFTFEEIVGAIKSASAHSINKQQVRPCLAA